MKPSNSSSLENWKVYSSLSLSDWKESENYSLAWTFEVIEEAFASYQIDLAHIMKFLVIPEGWKALTEETDTLPSVLCRTLQRYFDHLVDLSGISFRSKPYLSYAEITEIENFVFPIPQLIPKEPDFTKYYIRLSRALLHMFSYPGITTCRLEMDAERNTSLLLYSLFDWFGIIQSEPGSSVNEMVHSLYVFKRNSQPQWIRDGLIPIIYFPQRLQSRDEQKGIALALQGRHVHNKNQPSGFFPFTAAVEPTLDVLLAHSIAVWKEKRTHEEKFVLPDWLFLHGIVYSAVSVVVYSFVPKVLEFTSDGVPSKWEYVCVPTEPFDYDFFSTRLPHTRTFQTAVLLAIKRHTDRICEILNNVKFVPGLLQTIFESSIQERKDEEVRDGVRCANEEAHSNGVATPTSVDDSTSVTASSAATATQCLLECIQRTGLDLCCQGDWTCDSWSFLNSHLDIKFGSKLNDLKNFLVDFIDNWQSQRISLPGDWFTATLPRITIQSLMYPYEVNEILPKILLQIWTSGHNENFISLTEDELHARHFSSQSFSPDFFLSTPARKERPVTNDRPISIGDLHLTTIHCLEHFKDVYQYVSHELEAKLALSSPFLCTPGCWLKYDTQSRFPPALFSGTPPTAVDFSLLLHSVQTVPILMSPLTPDVRLRATILNPALVVAIQGPTLWPDEFACSPALSHQRPKDKSEALRQLAKAIEPSLKTHLINWQLRFEQGLVPSKDLPPWFMLFGLIYDAEEVTIVAHVPYTTDTSQYSFMSCIVDTISFPMVDGSSKTTDPWYLDRFRIGLALLSLQKHAFNMAGLWECVVWPDELVSWEEIVEREYLGPVLTPLERGYMVPLDPMSQVYLDVHGSDETIVDHSGDVSEDENEDEEVEDEDVYNDVNDGDGYGKARR